MVSAPVELRSVLAKYNKVGKGRCLYVDEKSLRCKNAACASHTVQRGGALRKIAEEGHVYEIRSVDRFSESGSRLDFVNTGFSKASIFPGFCKRHDNEIFEEIENGNSFQSARHAALLGYRVIAMEIHKKEKAVALFRNPCVEKIIRDNGNEESARAFLSGSHLGLRDLRREIGLYEQALSSDDFSDFVYEVLELSSIPPFCFCGPFSPEFSFGGELLLPAMDAEWSSVTVFCGVIADCPLFIVSGFRSDTQDVERFVHGVSEIPPGNWTRTAFNIAVEYCENSFFKRSWVDSLTDAERASILRKFRVGVPGDKGLLKSRLLEADPSLIDLFKR